MFINCSNHPSENWGMDQIEAAENWGEIVDYPFPNVPPEADWQYINETSEKVVNKILEISPEVVMCQGEYTLAYAIINKLLKQDIKVVAACAERMTEEAVGKDGSNVKRTIFKFVRFREYQL